MKRSARPVSGHLCHRPRSCSAPSRARAGLESRLGRYGRRSVPRQRRACSGRAHRHTHRPPSRCGGSLRQPSGTAGFDQRNPRHGRGRNRCRRFVSNASHLGPSWFSRSTDSATTISAVATAQQIALAKRHPVPGRSRARRAHHRRYGAGIGRQGHARTVVLRACGSHETDGSRRGSYGSLRFALPDRPLSMIKATRCAPRVDACARPPAWEPGPARAGPDVPRADDQSGSLATQPMPSSWPANCPASGRRVEVAP